MEIFKHPDTVEFLRRIRQDPRCNTSRSILADWLQDATDGVLEPFAALIRYQCVMNKIWPHSRPLSSWEDIPEPEDRRRYHQAEHWMSEHSKSVLKLVTGRENATYNMLQWDRGLLKVKTGDKTAVELQELPWWPLVSTLRLTRHHRKTAYDNVGLMLASSMVSSLEFCNDYLDPCRCFQQFDKDGILVSTADRATLPSIEGIRRVTFEMPDLDALYASRVTSFWWIYRPGLFLCFRPYDTFSRGAFEYLQQELGGDRVSMLPMATAVNRG